ncbi:MAG TPA: hypothetical protein VHP83_02570 [Aggregatilineaceae bacterium]|nr:hypothetical protein [Aggregatilineaceae bacterium]
MHRNRLLSLAVLLTLVISPVAVFAQDDEGTATFTSENGLFSFAYPKDWVVQETEEFPYGASIADSEATLEEVLSEDDTTEADPGQVGANIALFSTDFLTSFGFEMDEDMTFEDLSASLLDFMMGDSEDDMETDDSEMEATPEAGEDMLGEVETVEFENGGMAAIATYTEDDAEGAVVVFLPAENVVGVMYLATAPGEFTDDLRATALAIVESFQFTGTAEDLVPAMSEDSGDSSGSDTSGLDGNALVDERCTVCHDRGRIDSKDKDEAGWTETVDRMIGKGAQLNDEERQAVIDYLVETH